MSRPAWAALLAIAVTANTAPWITAIPDAKAQSGNSAALASIRAQIQRYGCHLPQYSNSVAGCRSLNARLRALQSGRQGSRYGAQPYGSRGSYPARTTYRPRQQPQSSGGFFSSLFGGGSSQSRRANIQPYGSHGSQHQGGLSGYSGRYTSAGRGSGGYRTLCVRTCDGYYWPMSFSTSRAGIARDAKQCRASCGAPARLFYHRNPGGDVQHSIDLDGKPYIRLDNAFRYRKEYIQDCRCKPLPWSEEATAEFKQRGQDSVATDEVKVASNATHLVMPLAAIQSAPASVLEASVHGYEPEVRQRRRYTPRYRTQAPIFTDRWREGTW